MATGIVYATESGIVRRIVVSDELADLSGFVQGGESLLYADPAQIIGADGLPIPHAVETLVALERGTEAETPRCRVIDDATGETVGFIMADPHLDSLPGCTLFQDADGAADWVPGPDGWEPPPEVPA